MTESALHDSIAFNMDLLNQLTTQTTLLTPNRRLTAVLLKQHQQLKLAQKKSSWQSPDILPITSWLERLWREYTSRELNITQLLLTSQQEQLLWEDILRNAPESEGLLQVSRTSEYAKSAWGILRQWRVDLTHPAFQNTEDNLAFQKWALQFQQICSKNNWIDQNSLAEKIAELIANNQIKLPKKIILTGFTELSPLYQHLLSLCESKGCIISHHESEQRNKTANRVSLTNAEAEIREMARWSKQLLTSNTDKIFIGCIIPNLEDHRDQVIQIFSNEFSTENAYTLNYTELPFNISAGKSLASYPIIHTALQLLNLYSENILLSTFSSLLRSPFLGDAENERIRRANLDSDLHNENIIHFSLRKLLTNKNEKHRIDSSCPALAKRLQEFFAKTPDKKERYSMSQWVGIFTELLTILGWPGERSLNSFEYQTVQNAWLPLLSQFASYDNILSPQTYKTALHYLMRVAANTVFQPQSPEAPIQILGMLEAVDLPFDYLWVSGLDDTAWPSPAKPNPFIPHRLQKSLNMPNATPDRELIYCKKLTTQLLQSADHVVFSHAMQTDKAELRPSALIKNFKEININELIHFETQLPPAQRIYESKQIEYFIDDQAPAISENENIRGGTKIFKLQAACPFKAFAEIRLHATSVETPTLGLRPQDRGNIVHKALEYIWQELNDLDNLHQQSPAQLQQLIHNYAKKALLTINNDEAENPRYFSLELQRLEKILNDWLHFEKSRPHFKVIMREQERIVTIGKIEIKLRVDRIDELENGTQFIIDYKTGKNNHIKNWFDDRPEEPQLPLYCITDPLNIVGISFAEIHPDSLKIKGVSKMDLSIHGVDSLSEVKFDHAPTWDEQIQKWRDTLEKLGDDFYRGDARVDPKNEETCQYCNLQALCRVYEMEKAT